MSRRRKNNDDGDGEKFNRKFEWGDMLTHGNTPEKPRGGFNKLVVELTDKDSLQMRFMMPLHSRLDLESVTEFWNRVDRDLACIRKFAARELSSKWLCGMVQADITMSSLEAHVQGNDSFITGRVSGSRKYAANALIIIRSYVRDTRPSDRLKRAVTPRRITVNPPQERIIQTPRASGPPWAPWNYTTPRSYVPPTPAPAPKVNKALRLVINDRDEVLDAVE
jgi:hypothetical protein